MEKNQKHKRDRLRPDELLYIQQNCMTKTDEELSKELNRHIRTIKSHREKLGVIKGNYGQIKEVVKDQNMSASRELTSEQRERFFQTQLQNSVFYKNLKEQFTPDELDFYLEEWGALCLQFEDIVSTEKRQIDELIKAEIVGNRILRNIRVAEDTIEMLIKDRKKLKVQIAEISNDGEITNIEDLEDRDNQLAVLVRSMHSQSQAMAEDYQKNVELRNKILNELNARRRDRIDQLRRAGSTFIDIVKSLKDQENKDKYGKYMELLRLAKEAKKSEWRQPKLLQDGSKDCLLLDEHSNIDGSDGYNKSILLSDALKAKKKWEILVIDDDNSRKQIFSDILQGHKLSFVSNSYEANGLIMSKQWDLICLDYDLGVGTKGLAVAKFLVDEGIYTPVLIHSQNSAGADEIKNILLGKNNIELYKFEDILSNYKIKE